MDLEQFVLANEPAIRLTFFLGVFALIGLWEALADAGFADVRVVRGGMTAWGVPRSGQVPDLKT